jgi:UDP-glucose 4-epimerase
MTNELVLVTGGAGFIGSHLCGELLHEGYRVRVLDDLSVGRRENVPRECEFIQGNIQDEELLLEATKDVSAICHQAARVTIRGSLDRFYEDAKTNLMGTLRLLKIAGKQEIKKFVYASSMAVYSDSVKRVPISEEYATIPASPYGIAKLAAERYLLMVGPQMGIEPIVLRYFNTFGIRQTYTPYVGVITIFVTQLMRKEPITIYGDGKQTRDFVHVSDVVQANLLALKSPKAVGGIFNIGSGRGTTVLEIVDLLKSRLLANAEVRHEPQRPEELRNSIANISQARKKLGYAPKTDLNNQIDEVIQYIRSNTK